MPVKKRAGDSAWTDPDDAPELTEAYFERADWYRGETLVRRGRPPLEQPKQRATLRFDADVLARLRATGPGWQTKVNAALREWLDRQAPPAAE
jgi:uncharacterized protein (DUF4415 family)